MSTYGSANLRRRIGNTFGKHIRTDTFFINLYNHWTELHNPQKRYLFWLSHIMWKLEMNIRRKWWKELPKVNIIFKKYQEEGEEFFNPTRFLIEFDCEKSFELLKDWKLKNEIFRRTSIFEFYTTQTQKNSVESKTNNKRINFFL